MQDYGTESRRYPVWQAAAWGLTALVCWGGFFVSLPGYYRWFIAEPAAGGFPAALRTLTILGGSASLLCAVISLGLGIFLFARKGADRGARMVAYFLLLYGFVMAGPLENAEYFMTGRSLIYSSRIQAAFFTIPLFMLLLAFPNGAVTPRASRWLIPFAITTVPMLVALSPEEISNINTPRSRLVFLYVGVLFLLALGAQVYRYAWKSTALERQQTKVVVYGIAVQLVLFTISGTIYVQQPFSELSGPASPHIAGMSLIWWGALSVLPVAISLAVFRARLWDIDFVIRRTLAYGFLTAALGLLYFGGVVLMQGFFRLVAGHESPLAIILSTLAIASLFNPLRRAFQGAIDRRFFRRKYDAEQALERFRHTLRDRIDLEEVECELTQTVDTTVQPEWVALWMRKT